jgi:HPt (histidine-containing phosphotransfer) domain-containing protein
MEKPNTNYIDELSADSPDFKIKIIEILKSELPEEIEIYENQIKNNDLANASLSVHKLKHKISILGLEKSYYIAGLFESNLKNNKTDLQTEFNNTLDIIKKFVNQL